MESFRRRDLTILAFQSLPVEVSEMIRKYHIQCTYVKKEDLMAFWKSSGFELEKLGKMKQVKCESLARRLTQFLLSSKKKCRLQGMTGFQRAMLYSSQKIFRVSVTKLERTSSCSYRCNLCQGTGFYLPPPLCSCCHETPKCFRCHGTSYSHGYYQYDVIITKN